MQHTWSSLLSSIYSLEILLYLNIVGGKNEKKKDTKNGRKSSVGLGMYLQIPFGISAALRSGYGCGKYFLICVPVHSQHIQNDTQMPSSHCQQKEHMLSVVLD